MTRTSNVTSRRRRGLDIRAGAGAYQVLPEIRRLDGLSVLCAALVARRSRSAGPAAAITSAAMPAGWLARDILERIGA